MPWWGWFLVGVVVYAGLVLLVLALCKMAARMDGQAERDAARSQEGTEDGARTPGAVR